MWIGTFRCGQSEEFRIWSVKFSHVSFQVSHCEPLVTLMTLLSQLQVHSIVVSFNLQFCLELFSTIFLWALVRFFLATVHVFFVSFQVFHLLATQIAGLDTNVDSSLVILKELFAAKAFLTLDARNIFGRIVSGETFPPVQKYV